MNHPTYKLCSTYEDALAAACDLARSSTLILDCEGLELGMPGGALSIIAVGDPSAACVYLVDALALPDPHHPLLAPLLLLLARPDVTKLVWDGRADFREVADAYGILMNGVLDLQLVEVAQRRAMRGKKDRKSQRAKHTLDYFKNMQEDLELQPGALSGVHRVYGLDHCARLFQVLDGVGGKDRESLLLLPPLTYPAAAEPVRALTPTPTPTPTPPPQRRSSRCTSRTGPRCGCSARSRRRSCATRRTTS